MSCEIKFRSSISELVKIKRILFPDQEAYEDDDERWSDVDAWTWKTDFDDASESKEDKNSSNWIQSCLISVSDQSEVLVITHEDRYVVLSSKWEKKNQKEVQRYYLTYPISNTSNGIGENITSVLCVPIKSLQKSSQGMPDWICVILGFNTGCVRMYTVNGDLLMTEAFHDEPVHHLKFHRSLANPANQELSILYQKIVIVVEGVGLFNSLRACRSYIAKGRALYGIGDLHSQHPPLHYKKLSLQEQGRINDCFILGTNAPTQFDHLVTASVAGGFQARYNNSPPVATGILSLGSLPYCAWHYAVEGSAAPLLSDVAYALASKVTSKLLSKTSGWLGWGGGATDSGSSKPKDKQITEPATPVYPRYGLADSLREALSVSVSPNEKLAAITDSLGRVVLIDLPRGIAVRMWKGYRDAQCAWIAAWEEMAQPTTKPMSSGNETPVTPRMVSFLVIYITKRGILEIWTPQQGTRVAAFNCCKGAKLISTNAGSSIDNDQLQCCLLTPDGKLEEVVVPFHCALKGDSSQKARDLHVLQQLRNELLHGVSTTTFDLLMDIRHASIVSQGLDLLLECRHPVDPHAFVKCLDSIVSHKQYSKADSIDAESRLLLSRIRLLSRLARLYIHLKSMQSQPPDYDTVISASNVSLQDVANALHVNEDEIARTVLHCTTVTAQLPNSQSAIEIHAFLCAFELSISHGTSEDCVRLKPTLSHDDRKALSSWIWGTIFSRNIDLLDELAVILKSSAISPENLVSMLVGYWLHLSSPALPNLLHFHKLLKILCNSAGSENFSNTESPSPWWQNFQHLLSKSCNLEQACCAALVVRSIMAEFEKRKINRLNDKGAENTDVNMDDSMNDWEDMSIDFCSWNVLSKQLEDLSYLSRLIHYVPAHLREAQSRKLDYVVEDLDKLEFSLASVLQKGRGAVSELIARWLTQNLLEAEIIFEPAETRENSDQSITDVDTELAPEADKLSVGTSEESSVIQDLFRDLSQHLPYSTQHDVILLNAAVEYAAMWVRNPKHMKLLQRSLETILPIRSNLLRHGICRTLWSMSFFPIFQDLAILIDKTGRLPKSFASRKISLPSSDQAVPFLEITMKLLDAATSSAMSCEIEPPLFIRYDDIWPTCEGATPMQEVAIRHRLINIDLVLLHHQLAQTLHLVASLEIKGVHVFSLFDQRVGRSAFFKDLHSYPPLPSQEADPTVVHNRLQFLKQVISKAIEYMEHNQSLALDYVNQAVKLGYEWNVDVDELRIKYVDLLYVNHMDHLAHEVLPSIGSDEVLGSTLLVAAGRRLKDVLKPSDTSALSPTTTAWLSELSSDTRGAALETKPTTAKTLALLVECLRRIPNESSDHFIANELHSLLTALNSTSLN